MIISWGWKIVILYCSFVAMMLFLVVLSVRENIDLVVDNYYEQDLKYETQIQKMKNAKQLQQDITLQYAVSDKQVVLHYPKLEETLQGNITLFRPSDRKLDFQVPINVDSANSQVISAADMKTGLWRVKIEWAQGKTPYYTEHTVFVE
jgi:hypothetical protein